MHPNTKPTDAIRDALRALPALEPPPSAFAKVMAARAAARRRVRLRRFAGLAAAASIVMAVALLVVQPADEPAPPMIAADTDIAQLIARSNALDQVLASVESQAGILDLRTAGTIVALEDRLAAVDAHLRRLGADEPQTAGDLLRQRIALVNALVDVHAAQTQYSF